MNDQQKLLNKLSVAQFAAWELHLYLDTHPADAAALDYYRNMVTMRKQAMDTYQHQFGPLNVDHVYTNNWDWISDPWPWEGGY